ncbi:MAG: S8 family serine peptidase [Methanosarcina sp.]
MTNNNRNDSESYGDKSTYYYDAANERRIPLVREPRVFAVRYLSGRSSRDSKFSPHALRLLREESDNIGFIPNYGLQLYQTNPKAISLRTDPEEQLQDIITHVKKLNEEDPVDYATVAYLRNPEKPSTRVSDLMFVTREFLVQFKPEIKPEEIEELNSKYRVRIVKKLDYAENGYLLEAPEAEGEYGPVTLANIYYESGMVKFSHPNFVRQRHLREVNESKLGEFTRSSVSERADQPVHLSQQWHLKTAKVIDAWNVTQGNSSIKITILDDGIDTGHQEFADKIVAQHDFASGQDDGSPNSENDNHGTACAGVAVAKGLRASGAAPKCSLIAVRYPDFLGSDEEAEMFQWAKAQGSDVISCSWGPEDGTGAVDPLPDNVRAAIHNCVTQGRNGLGVPIFWAAGNGNESVSNDGYASNPEVIAVAASSNNERRSPYSDFGPEIFICAPSSGSGNLGEWRIFTVDRTGSDGYNPDASTGVSHPANDHDYTDDFGGTSSATPLAAGIAGLMLAINPNLRLPDVKQILRDTADKIDQNNGNYDVNGHSNLYGYGRINALKAVERARDFNSGTPTDVTGQPSIIGPSSISRNGQAPTFQINTGGRRFYAVEVATRAELFNNSAHGSERNQNNFYASWTIGLESTTPYTLPTDVWDRLKAADRLFYRLHVADDNSWSNYGNTVDDEQAESAPSIQILGSSGTSGGSVPSAGPSIIGPSSISRNGQAPTFQINTGGRRFYAVEVATRAELFNNSAHGSERNQNNFYASWTTGLESTTPYTLPTDVWERLKGTDRLFYRLHVADDNSWSNYGNTVDDEQAESAPNIQITGGTTAEQTVTFPSGAIFKVIDTPQDTVDYSDPVSNGAVPLIEVHNRIQENLSKNFKVKELAATDGAKYARISPELVEGLQKIRDRMGLAVIINSGYRHKKLNETVDGADESQHMTGRAADIRVASKRPLDLARIALEELGCDIGIGLGRNSIHVDLRGQLATWRYEGAELNENDFDQWVRETCRQLGRIRSKKAEEKIEFSERITPKIMGPEVYASGNEAPTFYIELGPNVYYGVEVTTHPELFNSQNEAKRIPKNFYSSWEEDGLRKSASSTTTYTLPKTAWERIRNIKRLYYRIVGSPTAILQKSNAFYSTADQQAIDAPWIELTGIKQEKEENVYSPLNMQETQKADEALWRK